MTISMTGFASAKGQWNSFSWSWELRSVNSKGLDLRLRVPDWITGLEAALRTRMGEATTRGAITLSLRLGRDEDSSELAVNEAQLDRVLAALMQVEARAMEKGATLAPSRAADVLSQRGVLEVVSAADDPAPLKAALMQDFDPLLADFLSMRRTEGAALSEVLNAQLDTVASLTRQAADAAEARKDEMQASLRAALARVSDNTTGVDEARIAQELALIGVKADVTEELDRLDAHIDAARALLSSDTAVGRKFDFLAQEFNREVNTLCSKSQSKALTAIGLELKAVIDQMREQVQNVE
ncbi:YicC family protein [Rhodobacteraceae bacterium D3-12]|nr:YicC family protein [Rhodobacteraceae bacterium D3-12]